MDWNLKAASWDLSELDEATLSNIETVDGSSRFGEIHRTTKGEFSVDLKLGQVGNSGTAEPTVPKWKDAPAGVSKATPSPSGSSKRARAVNNGSQRVSCLVDGCNSDLSNCRDYHRRHKVCEIHSKTPQVTIGGQKQRFCQQCSRFHSLEEFDEGKRSCRKRLDGHNRRRRKPQPEPITTRSGTFLSNYQGTQLLPQAYPSTALMNPGWSNGVQQMHLIDKQDLFLGSSPSATNYKVGNKQQLAFLQVDTNPPFINPSVSHALLSSSQGGGIRSKTLFGDSLGTGSDPVHDTHCALSLLSSPHAHTSSGNGLNQMVQQQQHSSISFMQPLGLNLHDHHSLRSVDSVLVPNGSESNVLCPAMYNMGSDGSQGNEATPQPFPFHWE